VTRIELATHARYLRSFLLAPNREIKAVAESTAWREYV